MTSSEGQQAFQPNERVRLKGDPTRHGILTGRTRPGRQGAGLRYQVTFPDATSWVPEDQIESLPVQQESPVDLLQSGKLGRAVDLRRALTHMRLTGKLADVIYSMEATNTDFYPYQFKPVLRFLMSPSNALLIADEVGLGKTIEAGLIWTELRSRFDLRRLVILCPAILRDKWKRELRDKIGVNAELVDASGLLDLLQDSRAGIRGFAVICSLQGARPFRAWEDSNSPAACDALARFLRDHENDEPLIDLLVIDEAHYLRNPESQTHELGRLIRPVTANLLMLSATPIHNYNQDLFALLRLLDGDTFTRLDDLSLILDASRPLVEARDCVLAKTPNAEAIGSCLDAAARHPLLSSSRQLQLVRELAADHAALANVDYRARLARQLENVNPLAYVITRTRKRDVKEWRVLREPVREQISMEPCEENFYDAVTSFVIDYAMDRAANERFILATPQRQMSSSMAATLRAWQRRMDNIDDLFSSDEGGTAPHDIGPLTLAIIERAYEFGSVEELIAKDSKFSRFRTVLSEYLTDHPNEKVVVFSTFRETLNYLHERLASDGITSIVMHGGVKASKDDILAKFQYATEPPIQVLLSSEVGSEGIDLQFCRVLVNYDLPWNPMRVEQRIGRLDRLGQPANKILIWNLFYAGTIDARIYDRLYVKLDLCRRALGDFEQLLGDEIRKLTSDLLSGHLSDAQQDARIDQTAQALANLEHEQHTLENEASHLVAYGDYILNEVRAARELNRWINGSDLRLYVSDFLRLYYPGCVIRSSSADSEDYEIRLSNAAKQDLENFIHDRKLAATQLTHNFGQPLVCRFSPRSNPTTGPRIEAINQFHPLIRFVSFSIGNREIQLRPAVAVRVSSQDVEPFFTSGIYVLAVGRWSVDGLYAVEKLAFAAARLDGTLQELSASESERLATVSARCGSDWFEAKSVTNLDEIVDIADNVLFGTLEQDFAAYVEDMRRQNEDRIDLQLQNLDRHRRNRSRQLQEVRDRHIQFRRDSLAKAVDGQVRALENRMEQRKLQIEAGREIKYHNDEVLVGIIQIA